MLKLGKLSKFVAVASLGLALTACGDKDKDASKASNDGVIEVKLGVVGEHNNEWKETAKRLEKEGIKLTLVTFADYTLPNRALNDGEIDINSFQHQAYLKEDSNSNGYDLVSIGNTYIAVMGAYSNKIKSMDELKDGDTIAIPNDPTNGGRALKLVERAGLIRVDSNKGYIPTVRDIYENPRNLKFYEVDAGNTPSLIPDVAVAIINSNYAIDNNLDPLKDAIYSDVTGEIDNSNPYINIVAARKENQNNETFLKVIKAYQCQETADFLLKEYKGSQIAAFSY